MGGDSPSTHREITGDGQSAVTTPVEEEVDPFSPCALKGKTFLLKLPDHLRVFLTPFIESLGGTVVEFFSQHVSYVIAVSSHSSQIQDTEAQHIMLDQLQSMLDITPQPSPAAEPSSSSSSSSSSTAATATATAPAPAPATAPAPAAVSSCVQHSSFTSPISSSTFTIPISAAATAALPPPSTPLALSADTISDSSSHNSSSSSSVTNTSSSITTTVPSPLLSSHSLLTCAVSTRREHLIQCVARVALESSLGCLDLVGLAKRFSVPIVPLNKFVSYMENKLQKPLRIPSHQNSLHELLNTNFNKNKESALCNAPPYLRQTVAQLKFPFIIVESIKTDLDQGDTEILLKEFRPKRGWSSYPQLVMNGVSHPFRRDGAGKPIKGRGAPPRKKRRRSKKEYCEICKSHFADYFKHVHSDRHSANVGAVEFCAIDEQLSLLDQQDSVAQLIAQQLSVIDAMIYRACHEPPPIIPLPLVTTEENTDNNFECSSAHFIATWKEIILRHFREYENPTIDHSSYSWFCPEGNIIYPYWQHPDCSMALHMIDT